MMTSRAPLKRSVSFTAALILLLFGGAASASIVYLSFFIADQGTFAPLGQSAVSFTADSNHTASSAEYAGLAMNATSTTSLTATRNLYLPCIVGEFKLVTNSTTGSQSIAVGCGLADGGPAGTLVTVANGQTNTTPILSPDGVNYVSVGGGSSGGGGYDAASPFYTANIAGTAQNDFGGTGGNGYAAPYFANESLFAVDSGVPVICDVQPFTTTDGGLNPVTWTKLGANTTTVFQVQFAGKSACDATQYGTCLMTGAASFDGGVTTLLPTASPICTSTSAGSNGIGLSFAESVWSDGGYLFTGVAGADAGAGCAIHWSVAQCLQVVQ